MPDVYLYIETKKACCHSCWTRYCFLSLLKQRNLFLLYYRAVLHGQTSRASPSSIPINKRLPPGIVTQQKFKLETQASIYVLLEPASTHGRLKATLMYERPKVSSEIKAKKKQMELIHLLLYISIRDYSVIVATTPAPTVRPPSRIENLVPSSIAIGAISSTVISMLSPGITISTPSGRLQIPVTSVVRK